jgi:putative transposase
MRRPRIKAEGAGYYHCMSRIIERRHILDDAEKQRLLDLMQSLAAFGGLDILSYCFLSNHFHILLRVPKPAEVTDAELLRRLAFVMEPWQVESIDGQLRDYRSQGQHSSADSLKARFTYRMYDISSFFKALKQRFSQFYNTREGRSGPLWEQRFKSILVEGSEDALLTMAAYIDLNPVRAGLAADPKDYRYSSYGAAMGGCGEARAGLRLLMEAAQGHDARTSWGKAQRSYRQRLYIQGRQKGVDPQGKPLRVGFTPEQVENVIQAGGRLPMHEVLRCRVRYFSDGLALGSQAFLETVFLRYRGHFGPRRSTGARPMQFGDWDGLCTLRDLRLLPVSRT